MDSEARRQLFSQLLSDERALLTRLEEQLRSEHQHLAANDVDGLEQAGGARQHTIAKLLRLEDERLDLCRQMGASADRGGLGNLIRECDTQGTLLPALEDCARLAERCRAQNERNAALANARLNRVSGMLDMISGNVDGATYRPRNARFTEKPASRMVSVSA